MMDLYQHDNAKSFRFHPKGDLVGSAVAELERAWRTASSILHGKEGVVEVSNLTSADDAGIRLLVRMRDAGLRLAAASLPTVDSVARLLGVPRGESAATDCNLKRRALSLISRVHGRRAA